MSKKVYYFIKRNSKNILTIIILIGIIELYFNYIKYINFRELKYYFTEKKTENNITKQTVSQPDVALKNNISQYFFKEYKINIYGNKEFKKPISENEALNLESYIKIYKEKNRIIIDEFYQNNKIIFQTQYKYNNKGIKISEHMFFKQQKFQIVSHYKNNMIYKEVKIQDGNCLEKNLFFFNLKRQIIKEEYTDCENTLSVNKYEYINGKKLKKKYTKSNIEIIEYK